MAGPDDSLTRLHDLAASLQEGERPERRPAKRRRRRSRAVLWRRRLLALAVIVALGVLVWYFVLNDRRTDFAGRWEGSQPLLGSSTLVIKKDGDGFQVKGLEIRGQAPVETHLDDGRLYATGGDGADAWQVRFEIASDGHQLWAYLDTGGGRPEQRLRFTRARP